MGKRRGAGVWAEELDGSEGGVSGGFRGILAHFSASGVWAKWSECARFTASDEWMGQGTKKHSREDHVKGDHEGAVHDGREGDNVDKGPDI